MKHLNGYQKLGITLLVVGLCYWIWLINGGGEAYSQNQIRQFQTLFENF